MSGSDAALLLYWITLSIGFLTLLVMLISIVLAPLAGILSVVQARQHGYASWLYYGLAGTVFSLHLLLPWLYISLRLSGTAVPPLLIRAVYIFAIVIWAIYLVNGFVTLGIVANIGPFFRLVLYTGTFAFAVTVVLLVRNFNLDQRRMRARQTENDFRLSVRDFAYLTPFTFLIFHPLALAWETS